MPQAKQTDANGTDRVSFQLDKPTADKLDAIGKEMGKQAGAALGLTVKLNRTDVVRAIVDAKHAELQSA